MNRVMYRSCAVARFPSLCVRRTAVLLPLPLPSSLLPKSCASYATRRFFTTSLVGKLRDAVASGVSQIAENVWFSDEKLVTEPRRSFKAQRVANTTLAERITTQRSVRQCLVPTSIKVDKSRQYVEFTWPREAVDVMRNISLEADTCGSEGSSGGFPGPSSATAAGPPARSSSEAPEAWSQLSETATRPADDAMAGKPICESLSSRQPCLSSGVSLRTRALAEYLRAYTPSTDGALGSRDIIIYGRRGITITNIIPVGNYALRFVFSDDHSGGIYSYEYLYYLTGPTTKYRLMRGYITELRQRRKSRNPPKRSPSTKYAKAVSRGARKTSEH